MFCNQCGSPNPDTARFCSSCGSAVAAAPPPAMPPSVMPPPASSAPVSRPDGAIDRGDYLELPDGNIKPKGEDEQSMRAFFRVASTRFETMDVNANGETLLRAAWWAIDSGCVLNAETNARVIERLKENPRWTTKHPQLCARLGIPVLPPKPGIELTELEEEHLLWNPGDWYEVVPGQISFVASDQGSITYGGQVYTHQTFIFDSQSAWGNNEWEICSEAQLPNGPALLVLLCREGRGTVFGIVSMTNRAWTHVLPFGANSFIKNSRRFKELEQLQLKGIGSTLVKSLPYLLVPGVGTHLAGKAASKHPTTFKEVEQELIKVTRRFMHRIAQEADQYWPNSGPTGGRL